VIPAAAGALPTAVSDPSAATRNEVTRPPVAALPGLTAASQRPLASRSRSRGDGASGAVRPSASSAVSAPPAAIAKPLIDPEALPV
jgi:hypothetical protein